MDRQKIAQIESTNNMLETTLFDSTYESRKRPLLKQVLDAIRPIYSANELKVLRINSESRDVLSLRFWTRIC